MDNSIILKNNNYFKIYYNNNKSAFQKYYRDYRERNIKFCHYCDCEYLNKTHEFTKKHLRNIQTKENDNLIISSDNSE